jgi:hypothetical protein
MALVLWAGGEDVLANQQAQPRIMVESVTSESASQFNTQLILLAQGLVESPSEFEVRLAFDPTIVRPLGFIAGQGWESATPSDSQISGQLRVAATRTGSSGCAPDATCVLAEIRWDALNAGETQISVSSATITIGASLIEIENAAPAAVRIGAPSEAGGGPGALGWTAIALVGLTFAGTALWAVRKPRRTGRAVTAAPHSAQAGHSVAAPENLTTVFALYLEQMETEAEVFSRPDSLMDGLAREYALGASAED